MKKKIFFLFLIAVLFGAIIYIYPNEKVLDGISINGQDISKMTKVEAMHSLMEYYEDTIPYYNLHFKYGQEIWDVNYDELGFGYPIAETVEKVYRLGHGKNILKNWMDSLELRLHPKDVKMKYQYDAALLNKVLNEAEQRVFIAPVNASMRYKGGTFVYQEEKVGRALDRQQTVAMITAELKDNRNRVLTLPTIEKEPRIKVETLKQINDEIAVYTTSFSTSNASRSHNIKLAAKNISNILLMPGEVLSVNNLVGPRLEKYGFKTAKVIQNNQYVDGIGGGVCQVSSTLYNGALLADLKIVERKNHTFPSHYVPMGRDATINWGSLDLKFENSRNTPVYIYNEVSNGKITFRIFGANDGIKVKLVTETVKTTPPKVKKVKDRSLYRGTNKVDRQGKNGYVVNTYRIVYQNGVELKRELVSTDTYQPQDRVIRIGTRPKDSGKSERK